MIKEIYTDAAIRLFSTIKWKGKPIPVVEAGPERAFAQAKDWARKNLNIVKSDLTGDIPIPFPFCAVDLHSWSEETALSNQSTIAFGKDRDKGFGYKVKKPLAVFYPANAEFYFNDKAQKSHIEYQITNLLFPNRTAVVTIDFDDERWYKPPFDDFEFLKSVGQFPMMISVEGMTDNSNLEDAGMNERQLRSTVSLQLHALVPFQPYSVPIAEEVITELTVEDE